MQQGNETGKIIGAFAMVTTFIVLGIFSVLAYTKKPTDSEITEYIEEHRKPDVQGNTTVELSMTEAVTSWENTTEAILPTQLGNELLPAGATLKADATLPTIAGKYWGDRGAGDGFESPVFHGAYA